MIMNAVLYDFECCNLLDVLYEYEYSVLLL
jgi:hypothetical protein